MNNVTQILSPPNFFQSQLLDAPQILCGVSFLSLSGSVAVRMVSLPG